MVDTITIKDASNVSKNVGVESTDSINYPIQKVSNRWIPEDFTRATSSNKLFFINKGQLNELRMRPQVLNEHAESSRVAKGVVASGNHVGQIFKASQDNINGVGVALESAESRTVLDNFNVATYADSAALQAVWVASGNVATVDPVFYSSSFSSDQSMKINGQTAGHTWTRTIGSTDLSDVTFEFDFAQSDSFSSLKVSFFVGDGTNTKSIQVATNGFILQFIHYEINISSMSEDGGGTTDESAITKIGFRIDDRDNGSFAWVDNLQYAPEPGLIDIELWDMGAILPTSGVTTLDDGTQYTQLGDIGAGDSAASTLTLSLVGGKRRYAIDSLIAGVSEEIPTNVPIIVDNYYALVFKYNDTDVTVYGNDTSLLKPYYTNGFSFTAVDDSTAMVTTGVNDTLMFKIYSTQDVYITSLSQNLATSAGAEATVGSNAKQDIYIEDENMEIVQEITKNVTPVSGLLANFETRVFFFPKGGKFEANYNDDSSDDAVVLAQTIGYAYKPPTVNG